jgi:hypothetical protein
MPCVEIAKIYSKNKSSLWNLRKEYEICASFCHIANVLAKLSHKYLVRNEKEKVGAGPIQCHASTWDLQPYSLWIKENYHYFQITRWKGVSERRFKYTGGLASLPLLLHVKCMQFLDYQTLDSVLRRGGVWWQNSGCHHSLKAHKRRH